MTLKIRSPFVYVQITLMLDNVQASNAAGSDTARVRLEVSPDEAPTGEDPPVFLRRLQDLTVKVGTRTRFLVEIISSTECKVNYYLPHCEYLLLIYRILVYDNQSQKLKNKLLIALREA